MLLRTLVLLAVLGVVLLGACATPSVHPIFEKDGDMTDDRIVGVWRDADDKMTYTVTKAETHYRLHAGSAPKEKGEKPVNSDLEMHLVQIGAHRYIDVSAPESERSRVSDKHGALFVPTHMFARVEIHDDTVTVWWMKAEFVRQAVVEKSVSGTPLDERAGGAVLITSETEKLRAFIRNHVENEGAWDRLELRRVKDAAPK